MMGLTESSSASSSFHVAIIMDGNGRWARGRNLPRLLGHRAGIETVRGVLEAARALKITHLTLYSFSAENWRRPPDEVDGLMGLLRFYVQSEMKAMHQKGVRIRAIGDTARLPADITRIVQEAETLTRENTTLTLTLALSYGGRQEIAAAAQAIARAVKRGELDPEKIDEKLFQSFLFTSDMPDPDLVIRTSGEKRISNFLLWQSAYAEYVFMDVLWPDFSGAHLKQALEEFYQRDRRYGRTRAEGAP